jgi:uncharacterized protein YggU (UPF0235/DUF167 family)
MYLSKADIEIIKGEQKRYKKERGLFITRSAIIRSLIGLLEKRRKWK